VIRKQAAIDPDLRGVVLGSGRAGERCAAGERSEKRQWIFHLTCGFYCELLNKDYPATAFWRVRYLEGVEIASTA
jgi:hypothetical protein